MVRLPTIEVLDTRCNERDEAERKLLLAVLDGDPEAEREFVERFVPLIERCVRRLARSHCSWITEEDVRDVVGEVWVNLWDNDKHRLRRFDPSRPIKVSTWVGLLARNKTIDWLRSQALRTVSVDQVDVEHESGQLTPQEVVEQREREQLAGQAINGLNRDDRRFMQAWYVEGRDGKELASRLGVAVATVYSRRFKIVAKLARSVETLEQPVFAVR
jgi:RNA polymerase sigma factor (sigma-70 family)